MGCAGLFYLGVHDPWFSYISILKGFIVYGKSSFPHKVKNYHHCLRSRGSTGRTVDNPMGCNLGATAEGNIMVARLVIILILAMAKKVWWCLEQPRGSLLEHHVLFQRMLRLPGVAVNKVSCSLGHFGADSMKPIWVYSSNSSELAAGFLFSANCESCLMLMFIETSMVLVCHRASELR